MQSMGIWLIVVGPWQRRQHRGGVCMVDKVAHIMGDRKQETGWMKSRQDTCSHWLTSSTLLKSIKLEIINGLVK